MSNTELEQRIVELEARYTEQQDMLEDLSEVLIRQQRAIDRLEAELSQLKKRVEEPGLVDAKAEEKPPHY
jgi:SlyX protein